MRTLRILTTATLLAGTALVVPVVSVGAAPHAVAPDVERVSFAPGRVVAAAAAGSRAPAAPDAAATPGASPDAPSGTATPASVTESVLTRDTDGADVVGVTFPDAASARGVSVEVRSRADGSWGAWAAIGLSDSAPDAGTAEAKAARVA